MIAVAASRLAAGLRSSLAAAAGMPAANGSIDIAWPITPVEEGRTSSAGMPRACPTRTQVSSAKAMPFGAQVFALPLLTRIARA